MKLFGLAGWSGSGKTTLLIALLVLIRRGLRVATLKHVHHSIDLDQPGKDTHIATGSPGATEMVLLSASRWTLMHELREEREPTRAELLPHMTPVDLLLIEGLQARRPRQAGGAPSGRGQAAPLLARPAHGCGGERRGALRICRSRSCGSTTWTGSPSSSSDTAVSRLREVRHRLAGPVGPRLPGLRTGRAIAGKGLSVTSTPIP
jgi:hypothetical protein